MDTCTETETETSLIVRGKNVRAFNFRRSQPQTKILSRRIIPKLRYVDLHAVMKIVNATYGDEIFCPNIKENICMVIHKTICFYTYICSYV